MSNYGPRAGDQLPCGYCHKPILESEMNKHIQFAHMEIERYREQGARFGHRKGRKKVMKIKFEELW